MSDADSLKVAFTRPSLGQEEENAVLEVMRSGWLTTGKTALQFENDFDAGFFRARKKSSRNFTGS